MRRKRPPTLVFWPGEFHGLHSPWGHKELDATKPHSFHCPDPKRGFTFDLGPRMNEKTLRRAAVSPQPPNHKCNIKIPLS